MKILFHGSGISMHKGKTCFSAYILASGIAIRKSLKADFLQICVKSREKCLFLKEMIDVKAPCVV